MNYLLAALFQMGPFVCCVCSRFHFSKAETMPRSSEAECGERNNSICHSLCFYSVHQAKARELPWNGVASTACAFRSAELGPRSSGHPSSLCRVLSLQDAGGVPQRAPCSSQSRIALPLVNRLTCQPPVPCLDTQNIIGNIRERQRDRGGQQQAGGTQRPRSYLQAFPARVECVLVNPTSEEYKYLCCRNPSDEVLELAFSIHCSLSEVCLVLSPTDMTAAAPGAQQSPHCFPCIFHVSAEQSGAVAARLGGQHEIKMQWSQCSVNQSESRCQRLHAALLIVVQKAENRAREGLGQGVVQQNQGCSSLSNLPG